MKNSIDIRLQANCIYLHSTRLKLSQPSYHLLVPSKCVTSDTQPTKRESELCHIIYSDAVLPLPKDFRFQTNTSSLGRSSFLVTRNPSSQYVVLITISEDPGTTRSNASPLGNGGEFELIISPNGPSFSSIVLSSGLVVSTFNRSPSNPSAFVTSHRVVIIDVATPPNVATLTRETSVPVTGRALESISIVCVAGPTILIGAGMASVIPNI